MKGGLLSRRAPAQYARVLVASGKRMDLQAARAGRTRQKAQAQWQEDAWTYRDSVGEVRYAVAFLRAAVTRVRVIAAVAAPDGAPPTPVDQADDIPAGVVAAADEALSRLTSGTHNWGRLMAPFAENFEVPGECYLVGRDHAGDEVWEIRSTSELQLGERGWMLRDHPGDRNPVLLDPATSYVARLWHPHPRWSGLADSPMRALLGPCEELQLVARMIRGASRSRFAGAGILALPNSIEFASPQGETVPEDPEADPFLHALTRAMLTPIADEGDASAVVPIVLRAEAEAIAAIKHLALTTPIDDKLLARQDAALRRLAAGLDVPPEIVTGVADVNHWTAWQIDSSTITQHVGPLMERMVDALTAGYLRVALEESGVPPEWARKLIVWYDVDPLTVRPNRADDALRGHAAMVLSDVALVEALGFDPEVDMPAEEEVARRLALTRGSVDSPITEALLRLLLSQLDVARHIPAGQITVHTGDDAQDVEAEKPAGGKDPDAEPPPQLLPGLPSPAVPPDDPADDGTGDRTTPGPQSGLPASAAPRVLRAHRRASARLGAVDRTTRDRLAAAADAAMSRALEKAGNRLRSAANRSPDARAVVASVPAVRAAAALGPALVAHLGVDLQTLLAGAWEDLKIQYTALTDEAINETLDVMSGMTELPPERREELQAEFDAARGESWPWLEMSLTDLTGTALYDPDSLAGLSDDLGETPGRPGVVTTHVRATLGQAGGIDPAVGGVTRHGLPVNAGVRLGGIATGWIVSRQLRSSGLDVIAYEWVYGISRRSFAPHRALDGVLFADFDSPRLINPRADGWPHPVLAPGDHRGCHCDATPVWADGTRASDQLEQIGAATYDRSYLDVLEAIAADDTAAGRTGTTPQRVVAEARRVADARPSRRSS